MNNEKIPSKKLNVKMIALDLDDTLLNSELTITEDTVLALKNAAKRGIYIIPCSGRADSAILPFVRKLDTAGSEFGRYIIAMNGSSIFDLHKRVQIYENHVDGALLKEIYLEAKKRNLPSQVYDSDTIYASEDNKWTQVDASLCKLKLSFVDDFAQFVLKGYSKMVIPGDPDELQKFQSFLKETIGDRAVIFTSKPYFLEIMPPNAGKGEALEWLSSQLNIPISQTMAFGDSMNDESMIIKAGYGVAMSNGIDYIKKIADFITRKSNQEDGIADFVDNFVL
jgi:Cof subfamily protein (haloacid dehalogenase superfamily)